jgi:hypothetical protein
MYSIHISLDLRRYQQQSLSYINMAYTSNKSYTMVRFAGYFMVLLLYFGVMVC